MNITRSFVFIITFLALTIHSQAQISENNHLLYIKTFFSNGQYDQCIDQFKLLDNKQAKNKYYAIILADSYYAKNEISSAKHFYLKTNSLSAKKGLLGLSKCYALEKNTDSTIYYLTLYLEGKDKTFINYIKTDSAFNSINESPEWLALWKNDWYTKSELSLADADYEYRFENYNEAINILDEITKKRKSMHQAYQMKADCYEMLNDKGTALYCINEAVKLKPKRTDYRYQKAKYELFFKKESKALKSIQYAISMDSSEIDFYMLRAEINFALKNYEIALTDITSVNAIYESEHSLFLMSQIYFAEHDYLSVLKPLNKCIAKYGRKQDHLLLRANTYYKSGVFKYAENDFSSLLDYTPQNGEIYYWRGLCRHKQGMKSAACKDWQKARKYNFIKVDDLLEMYCY